MRERKISADRILIFELILISQNVEIAHFNSQLYVKKTPSVTKIIKKILLFFKLQNHSLLQSTNIR
jgi:hypothetical protein